MINSRKFFTPTNLFSPHPFFPVSSAGEPILLSQGVYGILTSFTETEYAPAFQYGTLTFI